MFQIVFLRHGVVATVVSFILNLYSIQARSQPQFSFFLGGGARNYCGWQIQILGAVTFVTLYRKIIAVKHGVC